MVEQLFRRPDGDLALFAWPLTLRHVLYSVFY